MQGKRKAGWSRQETEYFTACLLQAGQTGESLTHVFERVARHTGRSAGSVHNFYYAQRGPEGCLRGARVERDSRVFTKEESLALLEAVMTARAAGGSVRATAQQMAQGDPALMMRLQNKYRALLRHHPEWVKEAGERLAARGVDFRWPGTMAEEKEDAPADRQLEETAQRLRQLQRRLQDESRELGAIAQQAERQAKRGRPSGGIRREHNPSQP